MPGPPPPPRRPPARALKPWGDDDELVAEEPIASAAAEAGGFAPGDALDFLKLPGASGAVTARKPEGRGGRVSASPSLAAAPAAPPPHPPRTGAFDPPDPGAPARSPVVAAASMPASAIPAFSSSPPRRLATASIVVGAVGLVALGVGLLLATRTPAPPPVPPAPPPAPAFALLSSDPRGARVFVDGAAKVLETPAVLRLPAGSVSLRFEKEGFEPRTVPVSGVPGEARLVDEKLVPLTPPPAPMPVAPPAGEGDHAPAVVADEAPRKPKHHKSSRSKKKKPKPSSRSKKSRH